MTHSTTRKQGALKRGVTRRGTGSPVPHLDEEVILLARQVEPDETGLGRRVRWAELCRVWAQVAPCGYPRRPAVPGSSGLGCIAYGVVVRDHPDVLKAERMTWRGQTLHIYHSPQKGPMGFLTLRALAWIAPAPAL